jgi:hypothetical protein
MPKKEEFDEVAFSGGIQNSPEAWNGTYSSESPGINAGTSMPFLSKKFDIKLITFSLRNSGTGPQFKCYWHRVADPDPGYGAFLTPGSGIWDGKKSGSGISILDHISKSLITVILGLKFFVADPDLGSGAFVAMEPGLKNSDLGRTSRIRNTDRHLPR